MVTVFLFASPDRKPSQFKNKLAREPNRKQTKWDVEKCTRVLVGVEVEEIVGLLAEPHTGVASPELLHQKRVVLLHYLPDQLPLHCRHFPDFSFNSQIGDLGFREERRIIWWEELDLGSINF